MHLSRFAALFFVLAPCVLSESLYAQAVGTAFSYQGQLSQSNSPYSGTADLQFRMFTAASAGTQIGSTQLATNVSIANGLFTVNVDFGAAAFDGNARWIEIAVTAPSTNGSGPFTTLTPRQRLSAVPYASMALNAILPSTYSAPLNLSNATNTYSGSGASLTSLNASNLSSGTLGSARLGGTYSNALTLNNGSNVIAGNGTNLTNLNASNITSGTLAPALLSTGGNWPLSTTLNYDSNTLAIDPVNNRVGVGTASPQHSVDVVGGSMRITNTSIAGPGARLFLDGGGDSSWRVNAVSPPLSFSPKQFTIGNTNAATPVLTLEQNNGEGFLGINTTASPGHPLDILSAGQTIARLRSSNTGGTWSAIENTSPGGKSWSTIVTGSSNGEGPGHLLLRNNTDSLVAMALRSDGKVGVGTTSPQQALSVVGAVNIDQNNANTGTFENALRFGSFSGEAIGSNRNAGANSFGLDFFAGGLNRMSVTNGGNVGIGTTNPQAKLDVNGTIKAQNLPGVEYASGASSFQIPALTDVIIDQIDVDVPADGYLIISGDASFTSVSLAGLWNFRIKRGSDTLGRVSEIYSTNLTGSASLTRVLQVSPGTVTIRTELNMDGIAIVQSHGLTAVYVPNRY